MYPGKPVVYFRIGQHRFEIRLSKYNLFSNRHSFVFDICLMNCVSIRNYQLMYTSICRFVFILIAIDRALLQTDDNLYSIFLDVELPLLL